MAASERNNRRAEKAEIARHITTEETVAFMTALVAFLKEAEGAGHHGGDAQPMPADLLSTPVHAADPTPAETTPGEHRSGSDDRHADAVAAPTNEISTALHADGASDGVSRANGNTDVAAMTDNPVGESVSPASHIVTPAAPDHLSGISANSTHTEVATSTSIDPASSLQELGSAITTLVDTSLSAVAHTLDSLTSTVTQLTSTVTQLTSTVTGTIGQLTDGVTGLVGGLLHSVGGDAHDASSPDLFSALVSDIVSTPLAAPHDAATTHAVDIGGLDTAGAVPMAALPPLILHLGFVGQPTSDGHDLHDGAFSALGVHHF